MFRRWLHRWSLSPEAQIRNVRQSLDLPPEQAQLSSLLPLFVPASFFATGLWPGPVEILAAAGVGLTWALEQPGQTTRYVDHGFVTHWNSLGIDWKQEALENLARASKARLWTHELRRPSGHIYAAFMMHDDGYGPSRLLLTSAWRSVFPAGYRVALPEMSCGLALALDADDAEKERVSQIVADCFSEGTRPLAPGFFAPQELTLPSPADVRKAG
jgi:hypothetical protein